MTPDDLVGPWRSEAPLVSIGTHSRLDGVAASMVATLATAHGVGARVQAPGAFAAAKLTSLDLSTAALICLSYFDFKTTARVRYAARRAKMRASEAKLMLGLWTAPDAILEQIKLEVGADFVVNTLHEAATIILDEATGGRPVESWSRRAPRLWNRLLRSSRVQHWRRRKSESSLARGERDSTLRVTPFCSMLTC